jgi:hypothetical protein
MTPENSRAGSHTPHRGVTYGPHGIIVATAREGRPVGKLLVARAVVAAIFGCAWSIRSLW